MSSHSSVSLALKGLLVSALAVTTTAPLLANAATVSSFSRTLNEFSSQSNAADSSAGLQKSWLVADKDDKKGWDKDDKKGRKYEVRQNVQYVSVDLNRAKNLARQAAEAANGGIRVYRAEDSMHGPAANCPYVDNGDSWTFTFLGGRPGVSTKTIESVVTVYKNSPRVVVAYNGAIRNVQQTQLVSFTSSQRTVLTSLLTGNCECNYLLSDTIRSQIFSQRSLPPGIQKQLLRGKGLPPGIAKKFVKLPKQVNTYVNLPSQYDLLVIGSDLVLVDQVRYVVVDLISNVL
ncbi:MAG: hypothetical protein NW224_13850 [Leptolyngbyaceae cyanobacterium bins.302]|nr:hypothetical protein [Leptolyngbyaceae cyanobacterium bins.302]